MPKELIHGESMPKELIHGESLQLEGTDEWEHPVVDLRWNKESGDVHIVTRLHDAEVPSLEEHDSGIPVVYGYHVWLNRSGVNDLIRHLRRARDQAFGRDE